MWNVFTSILLVSALAASICSSSIYDTGDDQNFHLKPRKDEPLCTTMKDCSFLGECVDGVCVCVRGWTNPGCAVLNIVPSPINAGTYTNK